MGHDAPVADPLELRVLTGEVVVARLPAGCAPPPLATLSGPIVSVTTTREEVSVVCGPDSVPPGATVEPGWRVLQVVGPLDFALVGVLASLAGALAEAGISIFAVSTFDTDHLLVRADALDGAVGALEAAGHLVTG